MPTVLINDTHQNLYPEELLSTKEPKRVLIRIVKAVKLHGNYFNFIFLTFFDELDVEQPYCILELNHPKQIQQTSIAKNGLNPYVNENLLPKMFFFLFIKFLG